MNGAPYQYHKAWKQGQRQWTWHEKPVLTPVNERLPAHDHTKYAQVREQLPYKHEGTVSTREAQYLRGEFGVNSMRAFVNK